MLRPLRLLVATVFATGCLGVVGCSAPAEPVGREAPAARPLRVGSFDALVPLPNSIVAGRGHVALGPDTAVAITGRAPAGDAVALLRSRLAPATGLRLRAVDGGDSSPRITFAEATSKEAERLGPEGYRLRISEGGVQVWAVGHDGFIWAVQTLVQMLPPEVAGTSRRSGTFALPLGEVTDVPRYAWRGAMLDVARHFSSVDEVMAFVDHASEYKLNRVHLHLTDDQGWRLEIRSHPELTEVGAVGAVGDSPGGFYTQDQYRSIVAHASSRGVTIVPEIDVPGHTSAALASDPGLNCSGRSPELYHGVLVGFSSLCTTKESTYAWLEDVIGEVASLTPGRWIHIGGDESRATLPADYDRFMRRAVDLVVDAGKVPVGWEEMGAVDLPSGAIAQHWLDGRAAVIAADHGADVVLSPATKAYLDMRYDESTPVGTNWAGYLDTRTAYDWDPAAQVEGLDPDRVLGVEAPLWTESIETSRQAEAMLLPRLPALAEVAWSSQPDRSWAGFRRRIAAHGARWTAAHLAWTPDPDIGWPS